jgi:hypothetical protein
MSAALDRMDLESRAEVLMAMDVLMKHLNDEDRIESWLAYGVPDGAPSLRMTPEQLEYYGQCVDDFEDIVKTFANIVRRVCFKTTYEPKGFC